MNRETKFRWRDPRRRIDQMNTEMILLKLFQDKNGIVEKNNAFLLVEKLLVCLKQNGQLRKWKAATLFLSESSATLQMHQTLDQSTFKDTT